MTCLVNMQKCFVEKQPFVLCKAQYLSAPPSRCSGWRRTSGPRFAEQSPDDAIVRAFGSHARVLGQFLLGGDADVMIGQLLLQHVEGLRSVDAAENAARRRA